MADFQGTVASVNLKEPFAGHPGTLIFTITLTAAAYGGGNLNLSTIPIPGHTPEIVKNIHFTIGNSTAAYMVLYTPAATPTWANMGTLKLFTATGAEASGTLTFTITATAILARLNIVQN